MCGLFLFPQIFLPLIFALYIATMSFINVASMDLSVITVTWNSSELISEQIRSVISGISDFSYEQIIVDNNSSDHTVDLIKKNFPRIILIENTNNLGFAAANNQGFALSSGEFILFLNPDMRVEEKSLDRIITWIRQNPKVGIASVRLIDEIGGLNPEAKPRRFPTLLGQLALILKIPHLFPGVLDSYLMKDFDPDKEQELDSVRGSFMLVRRQLLDNLGWAFDPRYFFWFEDVDLCRETKKLGYSVMYTPLISCVDYVGQSVKKRDSLWKQKMFTRSMLTYFQKWEPWYIWVWIALCRPFGIVLVWAGGLVAKLGRHRSSS